MSETQYTILSVEDDFAVRSSYVGYLEEFGYRTLEAEDGVSGLEVFRSRKPDLVLLDLRMPKMDGIELLSIIKKEAPDTPVVIVSGEGLLGDAVRALRLGAWDYLVKPICEMSLLIHAVEKSLERARLIRENREYQHHLEEMVEQRTAQLKAANAELVETRLQIIRRLGKAAEYKDNETGRHVIRVSLYSEVLGRSLGLGPDMLQLLHHASLMHDIGKLGVSETVLNKPGSLDVGEVELMRRHCPIGAELLSPLSENEMQQYRSHAEIGRGILAEESTPLLRMAADIAVCHHEKWDGSGYPRGLKMEDIPLSARIVAVADVYDALASRRPYKQPLPHEECVRIIGCEAGGHFDPRVVEVFLANGVEFQEIRKTWQD